MPAAPIAKAAFFLLRTRKGRKLLLYALLALVGVFALVVVFLISAAGAVAGMCRADTATTGSPSTAYVSGEPSGAALADIPESYLDLYRSAGEEYGIDWAVLAAVGKIETDHGRSDAPGVRSGQNQHGCCAGPMQFHNNFGSGGGSWGAVGYDANGDGNKDIYDPADAIPSAAKYLVQGGAPQDYQSALYQYNRAQWYVDDVLAQAEKYRAAEQRQPGSTTTEEVSEDDIATAGGTGSITRSIEGISASLTGALSDSFGMREAHAVQNDWQLVDENRKLHYELDTGYAAEFEEAAAIWNSLGQVEITPSPSAGETDVLVMDATSHGSSTEAVTSSEGRIEYDVDDSSFDDATRDGLVALSAHEIGHALGFDHPPEGTDSLLTKVDMEGDYTVEVTDYDLREYTERWGEPSSSGGDSGGRSGGSSGEESEVSGNNKAVFPMPEEYMGSYSDTWGASRPYTGSGHEAVDIMAPKGTPLYAVTGGTVVEVAGSNEAGWNQAGGWALMVEAAYSVGPIQKGDRIYYAHRAKPALEVGDRVEAGQKIGELGDSGYGPEGTTGQFDPHLHIGWYDPTDERAQAPSGAMNLYPVLKWLEENGGTATGGPEGVAAAPVSSTQATAPAWCRAIGFVGGVADRVGSFLGFGGSGGGDSGGSQVGGGSKIGRELVKAAERYLGAPYVLGGQSPQDCNPNSIDCSCLPYLAAQDISLRGWENLPDHPQHYVDKGVGRSVMGEPGAPQAGDIIVYTEPADVGGHLAIATGNGNQIIHAAGPDTMYSPDYTKILGGTVRDIRRITGPPEDGSSGGDSAAAPRQDLADSGHRSPSAALHTERALRRRDRRARPVAGRQGGGHPARGADNAYRGVDTLVRIIPNTPDRCQTTATPQPRTRLRPGTQEWL